MNILVIDDDSTLCYSLKSLLLPHEVLDASDGQEGLRLIGDWRPDLVILDKVLPKVDGLQVCRLIKASSSTARLTPIVMLTGYDELHDRLEALRCGVDEYLIKPCEPDLLTLTVNNLLHKRARPCNSAEAITLELQLESGHPIWIHRHGGGAVSEKTSDLLNLNFQIFGRRADDALRANRHDLVKDIGIELQERIFKHHPEVSTNFGDAVGSARQERNTVHLRFQSSREDIALPLEFLYEDSEHLALVHPISKSIRGVKITRDPLKASTFSKLYAKREPLRVLLIGSSTAPAIPEVDAEIRMLEKRIPEVFQRRGVVTTLKALKSAETTYSRVEEELRSCRYHIVHYAGHGMHFKGAGERSSLSFWENKRSGKKPRGRVVPMTVPVLQNLLRNSDVRFVYLSCCYGAATGNIDELLDFDSLGIADGLVWAGVPTVLGFRLPVIDAKARILALSFYESLAKTCEIDTALLLARREVGKDDLTYLLPILIDQA